MKTIICLISSRCFFSLYYNQELFCKSHWSLTFVDWILLLNLLPSKLDRMVRYCSPSMFACPTILSVLLIEFIFSPSTPQEDGSWLTIEVVMSFRSVDRTWSYVFSILINLILSSILKGIGFELEKNWLTNVESNLFWASIWVWSCMKVVAKQQTRFGAICFWRVWQ